MDDEGGSHVVRRQKKPNLMGKLMRRSTKVEPQNNSSDDSINGYHNSTDQQERLLNHQMTKNKKVLERNNTCPALNGNIVSQDPAKDRSDPLNSNNNNRNSFCCTVTNTNGTLKNSDSSILDNEIQHEMEPLTAASSTIRPLKYPTAQQYNLPSYESYPSPILVSCRSRFREKFLLPSSDQFNSLKDQHHSTPDIPATQMQPEYRKSGSADNLVYNDVAIGKSVGFAATETAIVSADSLARQALMAAQVLHLIPTEKARQRNFLQGRSATNSLMGAVELDKACPTRSVTIFVGSWNMNGQNPPKQMNDFVLPNGIEHIPDIVTIGTQESCSDKFEWEVTLQETLGPSHVMLHSTSLGTLHLAVFIRRDLTWYCSEPEDASMSVRPGTHFKTKGAIAISFCLFGTTMLFVTSHLTAHQQKVKERVQDVRRIIQSLDLPRNLNVRHRNNKDVTQNFDSVYWCGDLNFRLSEPRANLLKWINETQFPLPPHLPHGYLHTDQLTSVLADGAAFKGFKEAKIQFPPTYKYDVGTQNFDTSSKQRAPAYTDRILYKHKLPPLGFRRASAAFSEGRPNSPPSPIKCIAYDSVSSIVSSDHKPVWALFKNALRPGIDSIPLAAGLFNREVFIEGIKHRLDNNLSEPASVCSIQ